MSLVSTLKERVAQLRERRPFVDHVVRMVEHYGTVKGSALAAAVTYFAFLSFFPILALSFAVIGLVSRAYPDAEDNLVTALNEVLPGIVGGDNGLDLSHVPGQRARHPQHRDPHGALLRARLAVRNAHGPRRGLRGTCA